MKNKFYINSLLFTLGTVFFCISAQADEGNPLAYCGNIDPKAALGTICSAFGNSSGGIFVRVKTKREHWVGRTKERVERFGLMTSKKV